MLVKNEKFRKLYCSLIVLKSVKYAKEYEKLLNNNPNDVNSNALKRDVNSLLLYPYIDHDSGMSFLVVATALSEGNNVKIYNRNNFKIFSSISKESLNNCEFKYLDELNFNSDFKLTRHANYAIKSTKVYRENEDYEDIRMVLSLDRVRSHNHPDDVLVLFLKDKLKPESLWVRLEEFDDGFFKGNLLNQPKQDFGVLKGDKINVLIKKDDEGNIICFTKF